MSPCVDMKTSPARRTMMQMDLPIAIHGGEVQMGQLTHTDSCEASMDVIKYP